MNSVQESLPEEVLPRVVEDSFEEEGHLVIDTTESPSSPLIPIEPTSVVEVVDTAEHSKVVEIAEHSKVMKSIKIADSFGAADLVNEVTCPSAMESTLIKSINFSRILIPPSNDTRVSIELNETIKSYDISPSDTSSKDIASRTTGVLESNIKAVSESSIDFSPTQIICVSQSTPIQTTVTSSQMSSPPVLLSSPSGAGCVGDGSGVLPPFDAGSSFSSDEDDDEEDGSLLGFGQEAGGASSPSDVSSLNATFSPGGSAIPRSFGSKSRRKSDRILPLPGDDGSDNFVCPVCREVMPSLHDFTKHIRQHNTVATVSTINTCTICAKILSSQSSLDRHMLVHSGERPFQCRVCRMAFTTNGNMHRHMRIHEKDFPLPGEVAPNTQVKETSRSRGKKKHAQVKLEMSPTGEIVTNEPVSVGSGPPATGARKRKQRVNGSAPSKKRSKESGGGEVIVVKSNEFISANVDVLSSIPSLNNRMILEPVDINLDATRKKCPVCSRLFFSKYGFTNHLYTHEKYRKSRLLLRCSQCNLGWTSLQQHESHMRNVHKTATDKDSRDPNVQATANVEEKPAPVETKKSKENKNAPQAAIQSLDLTSIDFTSEKFPLIAKVSSEKAKSKSSVDKSVDKTALKICKTCDKIFACTPSLTLHMTRHKPDAQTACDTCDQSFSSAKLFKDHALMTHEKDDIVGGYAALEDDEENGRLRKVVSKDEFMLIMGMKMTRAIHMKPAPVVAPAQALLPVVVTEELLSPVQNKVQLDANQNLVKAVFATSSTETPKLVLPKTLLDLKFHRVIPKGSEITPTVTSFTSLNQLAAFNGFKFQLPQSVGDFQMAASALLSAQRSLLPPMTQGARMNSPRSFFGVMSSTPIVKSELDSTKSDASSPLKLVASETVASGLDESRILPPTGLPLDLNAVDVAGAADDSNESGNNLMMELDSSPEKEDNSGPHACQYCDEVFFNYRAFKGHVRSHLSSSPYKCTQCSYCSTDKSTLIRHLRTHNGERPFQCLICDFAFTTKANCERHVRKKHMQENKDEIESNIGYNRQMAEASLVVATTAAVEPPAGIPALSDTVCKYCGEDFKFFRALKHHVRSQTSCQHKPFLCKICGIGFSTKANCIRHIQKQHPEVESSRSESQMQVKMDLLDAQTRMRAEGTGREESNARKSDEPRGRTAKRRLESPSRGVEGSDYLPLMLTVNPLNSPQHPAHSHSLQMKQEYADMDQPLDFSIKSHYGGGTLNLSGWDKGGGGAREMGGVEPIEIMDQPMDLTVKPRETKLAFHRESDLGRLFERAPPSKISKTSAESFTVNCASSMNLLAKRQIILSPPLSALPANAAEASASYSTEYSRYYNPALGRLKCPDCPIQFKDGVKLLIHMRSHSSNSHQCRLCSTSFSTNAEFEKHIKLRHPQFYDFNARSLPSKEPFTIYPEAATSVHLPVEQNNNNSTTLNANVRFMINDISVPPAAAAAVAVAAAATASSRASNSDLEAVSKILEAAARSGNFPTFYPASGKGEIPTSVVLSGGDVKMEGGGPSVPPKKELITIDSLNQSMAQCFQLKAQEEMNRGSFDLRDFDTANDSGEQSLEFMTKKKRNSYADSPHKLRCPYCPRAFPWISSLKRHILTHTGQKPFRCPQCTVTFSTKSNRERHMIRKHGLDVHDPATRQMMDRPYKCHLCVFSSFASSSKLIRHYRVKHPDQEIPDSLASNMASMSQEELNIALNNLGGVREEPRSGDHEAGMHDYDDEDDEDDDDDSISEEQAEAERLTMEYLSANSASRAPSPAPETSFNRTVTPPLQLKHSARSTPDFTVGGGGGGGGLDKLHHINPERDNYNVDKITECWKCWKTFDSRKTLLRHLKEHSIDLPFKCYLCDASFNVRLDSLKHKAVKHVSEWLAVQEKNKVGLLADYSELMDKVVEETLAGNVTRRVHEGIDLDIKPESDYAQRKVFCTLCPKRFWSLQDLRRHMRSHTGERPFECSVCQARFTLKHSMMRHRRKHTDEPGADLHGLSDEEEDSLHSNEHDGEVQFLPSILESSSNGSGVPLRRLLPDVCLTTYKQRIDAPARPATAEASATNNESSAALDDVPHSLIKVSSSSSFQSPSNVLSAAVCVQSDLLQNLLGITDVSTIDQMLDSPNEAATMLGIQKSKKD